MEHHEKKEAIRVRDLLERTLVRKALAPTTSETDSAALLDYAEDILYRVVFKDSEKAEVLLDPLTKAEHTTKTLPEYEDNLNELRRFCQSEFKRINSRKRSREEISDARCHARLTSASADIEAKALERDYHSLRDTQAIAKIAMRALMSVTEVPVPGALPSSSNFVAAPAPSIVQSVYAPSAAPRAQQAAVLPKALQDRPTVITEHDITPERRYSKLRCDCQGPHSPFMCRETMRSAGGFGVFLPSTRAKFEAWDGLGLGL